MILQVVAVAIFLMDLVRSVQRFGLPSIRQLPFVGLKDELQEKFLKLRYPVTENTRWYYTGSISDPANGMRVAGIEGLEFLSPLKGFNVSEFVTQLKGPNQLSTTIMPAYLSHKCFIYTNDTDRSLAKTTFRKNKLAPDRKVSPVNEFTNIVTLGNRVSEDSYRSYIVWPSKRLCQGIVCPVDSLSESMFALQSNVATFQHKISSQPSRKVNKWIAFGGGRDNCAKSVEKYSISQQILPILRPVANMLRMLRGSSVSYRNSPVVIQYRRYGESPAWLAPGRHCEIVINGYKIDSIRNVPIATQKLFLEHAPHMLDDAGISSLDDFMVAEDRSEQFRPWYSKAWRTMTRQKEQKIASNV